MFQPATITILLYALASSATKSINSKELAKKIKAGDHGAFKTFFDSHYDALLRFLISKNTSKETAKDLIQKAFTYIWEHRHKINPDKSLRAYIFQIAYTRMLNHHRDNSKFNTEEAVPHQKTPLTPEDTAFENDLKSAINRAIEQMPEKRGTVFQLCFMDDFTYKEASDTLDVSPKTIENHMRLALKDMRNALKNFR